NLAARGRATVHSELRGNPARLEQRIGRVDRIGQRRTVHAITLVARDTAEDLVVARLARRLTRVAATLGERDRLAALLSDARTAHAVIAGASPEIEDEEEPPVPPVARAAAGDYPVDRVALQLSRTGPALPPPGGTAIARLHATGGFPPGLVAIVRAALVTDRGVAAERPFVFRAGAREISKPATHRGARAIAGGPI